MNIIQWLIDEPLHVLLTSIALFVVFAAVETFVCLKTGKTLFRLIPLIPVVILGILVVILALASSGQDEWGMMWIGALILSLPIIAAGLGMLLGWLLSVIILKKKGTPSGK